MIGHGSDYEGDEGAAVHERYDGTVGVSTADPGLAWARASAAYRVAWPGGDCRTEARLDLRSTSAEYHVVVEMVAEEPGGDFRRERRWERVIPRRLQ